MSNYNLIPQVGIIHKIVLLTLISGISMISLAEEEIDWRCPIEPIYVAVENAVWTDGLKIRARLTGERICEGKFSSNHCPLSIYLFPSGHIHFTCSILSDNLMRWGSRGDLYMRED